LLDLERSGAMTAEYSPADEYNSLRNELLQGKKYVFERPLLIITLSFAGLNFMDKAYVAYLPPMAIGLLMFNLWFTVNRMRSIARIVAYIQIELEEKLWRPWLGWETCLRHYRMWGKEHRDDQQELVESWIDRNAVPDAIGYYPTIFIMHVAVVLLLLIGSLLALLNNPSTHAFILFALTFLTVIWFSLSALKWRPNRYPPVVTLVLIYLFVGNGPGGVPQICQKDQIVLEEGD
jgi:hypothetical protein